MIPSLSQAIIDKEHLSFTDDPYIVCAGVERAHGWGDR